MNPEVTFFNGELRLYCDNRMMDRALAVPGLKAAVDENGNDYWRGRPAWGTIIAIGVEFEGTGLVVDPQLDDIVDWNLAREKYAEWIKTSPSADMESYDPNLYDYQRTGAVFLAEMGRAALTDEMGTGKTVMALSALAALDAGPALVVCPTSMTFEWAAEGSVWAPHMNFYVLTGTKAAKTKLIEAAADDPHAVIVSGWSGIRTLSKLKWYGGAKPLTAAEKSDGPLQLIDFQTVIADEVHRAKDPKAKQTMALMQLSKEAHNRWGLTGTLLSNHPGDVWTIMHYLDPDEWPSRSKFFDRYVLMLETNWGPKPVAWKRETRGEIDRLIGKYILRRTKAEVLPWLPDKTYQVREVEMSGKQLAAYKRLKKDMLMVDEATGEVLVATDPLSQLTRLSQAASATPVIEGGEVTALSKPSNKVDALMDILDELPDDKSVVVFAESRKLLELVAETLEKSKISFIEINGEVPAELRSGNIATFQAGNAQVALVTLGAGAEGITLTRADTAVFLQRSYSMVKNLQAEDRIHRVGQDSDKVLIIDIVSKNTVDVAAARAAERKEDLLVDTLKDRERLAALVREWA